MSNTELEFWELQRRDECDRLMTEAQSLGLNALTIVEQAIQGYKDVKQVGLNRALVEADIRSELDASISALKAAIGRALKGEPSA